MFVKPTITLIGHRDKVRIAPGCERVDWEVGGIGRLENPGVGG